MIKKNILFLVTGMTPQIITETVWALACDPDNSEKWVPDEIHVLSTQNGLYQIKKRLFDDGIFAKFITDYAELKDLQFTPDNLHVITNKQNESLLDLRTPEENEQAANIICSMVHDFTKDDNVALHVSIAGGRKTMGFYAGYALSLYGRAQDRMSHVLVDEKFEKAINFFYVTPYSKMACDRDEIVLGDAKDAKIWLANIPFIRMRDAILPKHQIRQGADFIDVVSKINESYSDVSLKLDVHHKTICINNKFFINDLAPREFAFLYWFAKRRKLNQPGIIAPKDNMNSRNITHQQLQHIAELNKDYGQYYQEFKNSDIDLSVDKRFFEGVKSLLKKSFEQALGLELAAKIAITQQSRGEAFYLDVSPDAIEIVDAFKDDV